MGRPAVLTGLPKVLKPELGEPNQTDRFSWPGRDRQRTTPMVRCPLGWYVAPPKINGTFLFGQQLPIVT